MMDMRGGLLGAMSQQPQMQQTAQPGQPRQAGQVTTGGPGLLGVAGGPGLQLAMSLAQNPTQQNAQQIIAQLKRSGNPEADQFERALMAAGGNPTVLKRLAESVIQTLSGGGNA
ncbi:MAG TPA: hypothetical protein VIF60_24335 [Burkholderiaceae bacterium]